MSADPSPVLVTGVGVVTALGADLSSFQDALCAGRRAHRSFEPPEVGLPPQWVADLPDFDPGEFLGRANFRPLDRTSRLAACAAALALEEGGWTTERRAGVEIGLVLGTMFGSLHTISGFDRRGLTAGPGYVRPFDFANSVINAAAGQTAIWHDLKGVNATISADTASGLQAIGYAADLIRNGHAEVVLAGGAEELSSEALWGFARAGWSCGGERQVEATVPFDRRRAGFAPGEAAVFLVLESAATAAARGARPRAEIAGFASAFDGAAGGDDDRLAALVERVVEGALAEAGRGVDDLDCVSAGADGSPRGDRWEAAGLARLGVTAPVTAVKAMLGETLGAAGALQVAALLATLEDGRLPGIAGLEAGEEAAALDLAAATRRLEVRCGLAHALGLDGSSTAVVVRRPASAGSGR